MTNPFPFIYIFIICENSNPKCYCGVRIAVVRTLEVFLTIFDGQDRTLKIQDATK